MCCAGHLPALGKSKAWLEEQPAVAGPGQLCWGIPVPRCEQRWSCSCALHFCISVFHQFPLPNACSGFRTTSLLSKHAGILHTSVANNSEPRALEKRLGPLLPKSRGFCFQNERVAGVGRAPGDHLLQPPWQSRFPQSRLQRTASRRVVKISGEGDSTTCPGRLLGCCATLKVKKCFLVFLLSKSVGNASAPCGQDPKDGVLVSAGLELVFLPAAAVFWVAYEKSVDQSGGCSCC